ncbi:hypothetical protein D3C87_1710780 [compost metagenome]
MELLFRVQFNHGHLPFRVPPFLHMHFESPGERRRLPFDQLRADPPSCKRIAAADYQFQVIVQHRNNRGGQFTGKRAEIRPLEEGIQGKDNRVCFHYGSGSKPAKLMLQAERII